MSLQVAFDEGSLQEKEAAKREFFAQGYPRSRAGWTREPNGSGTGRRGAVRLRRRRDTGGLDPGPQSSTPGATTRQKQRSCVAQQ